MNEFTSKTVGAAMFAGGIAGSLTVLSLILFFVGQFQNVPSLSSMGALNDRLNVLTSLLSAILAWLLYPALRRTGVRWGLGSTIAPWIGATAVAYGSWLILTNRADVELSSYYFFFGNALTGLWLWRLNRTARKQTEAVWPRTFTRWGVIASAFMMMGVLSLYGILLGMDGNDFSPLVMASGISFLGTGILYPIWCLRLGSWILTKQDGSVVETG